MKVPFVKTVGIIDKKLEKNQNIENHLGSIHAGAIFTFAENASGEYLRELFPDLADKIIPLLRESSIKYKKQAKSTLRSEVSVLDIEKFKAIFWKKSRASVVANVKVFDNEDDLVCEGSFKWYIQMLDQKLI
jgi:acyl-coenzyme A thioesterase PaaI-like protein